MWRDLFFFSSRRRHTRCLSDWSSDVCSSDLPGPLVVAAGHLIEHARADGAAQVTTVELVVDRGRQGEASAGPLSALIEDCRRSEERRVGKEWRSGWSRYA